MTCFRGLLPKPTAAWALPPAGGAVPALASVRNLQLWVSALVQVQVQVQVQVLVLVLALVSVLVFAQFRRNCHNSHRCRLFLRRAAHDSRQRAQLTQPPRLTLPIGPCHLHCRGEALHPDWVPGLDPTRLQRCMTAAYPGCRCFQNRRPRPRPERVPWPHQRLRQQRPG